MKERFSNRETEYFAEALLPTFFNRWDDHALQLDNGKYLRTQKPITPSLMVKHLSGEITLGSYILDQENKARFIVFDADDNYSFSKIREFGMLSMLPHYCEASRRGGHIWMFLDEQTQGINARRFGIALTDKYIDDQHFQVEIFPKQGSSDGPGSLIRVPFGIHRKSGQRYPFIDRTGNPIGTWERQMEILSSPETVPMDIVDDYQYPKDRPPSVIYDFDSNSPWEQIKKSTDIINFIGTYIDLRPTRIGGVGLCPFHDDRHASFGVNKEGKYWHCFAGCGGGSVIDFWMLWRDCDFKTAVSELTKMMSEE